MRHKLPETYAHCDLLPFNRLALEADFALQTPAEDPGGSGVRLLMQGSRLLVTYAEDPDLPDDDQVRTFKSRDSIYIGLWKGTPCRLQSFDINHKIPDDLRRINILDSEPGLPLSLLSLAGLGNAVLHWENTSQCCDNCGCGMVRIAGDWGKKCTSCTALHYPRIHPCIIVLVRRDSEILLVRKSEWVQGRFGLVAGFVEFGENLEQTVERELFEETGIKVTNVQYQGSQSWPFPSQLMTGFTADYESGELILQDEELAEAGWYSLNALPQLPPRRSIARWLIDKELNDLQDPTSMIKT